MKKEIRENIYNKYNGHCAYCGREIAYKDMQVDHLKSTGKWDYNKLRTQHDTLSSDELEYIEHDTLAGVECIDKTIQALNKKIWSLPYTATRIPTSR